MRLEGRLVGLQERVSSRALLGSEWLSIRQDRVVDQLGNHSDYWVLERSSFVLLIPYRKRDDHVALVWYFRYPVGRWFWEFPQARLSDDNPETLTGVAAQLVLDLFGRSAAGSSISIIGGFFEAYGYSDHRCYCMLAELEGDPVAMQTPRLPMIRWESREALVRAPLDLGIGDAATIASLALLNSHDLVPRRPAPDARVDHSES
jgi:hypothetical protein